MNRRILAVACISLNIFSLSARSADVTVHVSDESGQPVPDSIVVAVPSGVPAGIPPRRPGTVVEQNDLEFVPFVTAVLVGSEVSFPNHDRVRHHVYSFSPAKRFDLPLYAGTSANPVIFDKPGVVVIGCNIHDWMVGYIYVSESQHFAKTNKSGTASMSNLPPGTYLIRVWHPRSGTAELATQKSVDVTMGKAVDLQWVLKLNAEVRVRRAPVPARGSHY